MQVNAGRIDIWVTEQLFNVINTYAGFQQVSGETMPHSMDCHIFSDISFLYIFIKKILYSFVSNVCTSIITAVKEPLFRAIGFPVSSEHLKIGLRKQGISIFATLGIADKQLHIKYGNICLDLAGITIEK